MTKTEYDTMGKIIDRSAETIAESCESINSQNERITDLLSFFDKVNEFQKIESDIDRMRLKWERECSYGMLDNTKKYPCEGYDEYYEQIIVIDNFLGLDNGKKEELLKRFYWVEGLESYGFIMGIPELKKRKNKLKKMIKNFIKENPKSIKQIINEIYSQDRELDDLTIDTILGLNIRGVDKQIDYQGLRKEFPKEELWSNGYRWTSYEDIISVLKRIELKSTDTLYDLGSGFGRLPIFASLVSDAKCKGIELVPQRVSQSLNTQELLDNDNLEFTHGNVLEQDFSDGNVFFLFNPFSKSTLEQVGERLKQIAKSKKIKIICYGECLSYFYNRRWLMPIKSGNHRSITIFESIDEQYL